MKKVLFISSEYFPKPSPNGMCIEKIMRRCQERGYSVVYLGATFYADLPKHENINGIDVYRVKRSFSNMAIRNWQNYPTIFAFPIRWVAQSYYFLKRLLLLKKWPLDDLSLVQRFLNQILELHKQYNFDAVLVTYNPLSAMVAVNKFHNKFKNIPCVYCYLDALSAGNAVQTNEQRFRLLRLNRMFFKMAKRWEIIFSKHAKRIIAIESTRSHYEKCFSDSALLNKIVYLGVPVLERKIHLASEPDSSSLSYFTPGKKHILFVGSMYVLRDPTYIIDVAKCLRRDDIEFIFIGLFAERNKKILKVAKEEMPALFKTYPAISRSCLEKYMQTAHFFLNIEDNVKSLCASKIFEYISYGKPIISNAFSFDDPTVEILKKYENSVLLYNSDDVQRSAEKLNRFIDTNLCKVVDFDVSKDKFYRSTPDAYVDVLDDVFRDS